MSAAQASLFDDDPPPGPRQLPTRREAHQQAREGEARAFEAAEEDWKRDAADKVLEVAARGDRFCSNDVWAAGLADPPGDRRALGGVMRRLASAGHIELVGRGAVSLLGHGSTNNAYWRAVVRP